jgi:hypothetical protein
MYFVGYKATGRENQWRWGVGVEGGGGGGGVRVDTECSLPTDL